MPRLELTIAYNDVRRRLAWGMIALLTMAGACANPPPATDPVTIGRQTYLANCASCHNANPNLPGSLGPPIAGSPRPLVEARVLHQSYPPGYVRKRNTHLMRSEPWLAPKIDDITAFLAYAKEHGHG